MPESWPPIGLQNGKIFINPTEIPAHVGEWNIQIKACLDLTGLCQNGPISTITVINPCFSTQISGGLISYTMTAPRLGSDGLSLFDHMGAGWPFADSVDVTYSQFQNCGMIDYVILDSAGNPLPSPPIVSFQGDNLVFTPQLNDPLGPIDLILRGYLVSYFPDVAPLDIPFQAVVTACDAQIDVTEVRVSDKEITWGDVALPYNIQESLNQYSQSPACQYEYLLDIKYEDMTNAPGLLVDQAPPEIQYNGVTTTFTIEKCADNPVNPNDSEC